MTVAIGSIGYHVVYMSTSAEVLNKNQCLLARPSASPSLSTPYAASCPCTGRTAAVEASPALTTNADIARPRGRRSTSSGDAASCSTSRAASCSGFCSFPLVLGSPRCRLSSHLLFRRSPLCRLLLLYLFVLNVDKILTCALPLRVQNESLVVLCLGEDSRPRL